MRIRPKNAMVRVMMSKKVLIVEDNELNMKLFHDLLDAQGYETLETREGLQALALARAAPARPDPDGHPAAGDFGPRSHQVAEGRRRAQPTSRWSPSPPSP